MKRALRDGVKVFERHEADTAKAGGQQLVAAVASLPQILATYLAQLAALTSIEQAR